MYVGFSICNCDGIITSVHVVDPFKKKKNIINSLLILLFALPHCEIVIILLKKLFFCQVKKSKSTELLITQVLPMDRCN